MRLLQKKTFVAVLLMLPLLLISTGTFGAGRSDFIDWASDRGEEIDSRWDKITHGKRLSPLSTGKCRYRRSRSTAVPAGTGGQPVRVNSINASEYTRSVGQPLLPRTSRERSGPTRGRFSFENPARMNHGLSNRFRRPRGSSAYRWNSAAPRGTVSRPRLKNFGRISASRRRSRPGVNISPFSGRRRRRR